MADSKHYKEAQNAQQLYTNCIKELTSNNTTNFITLIETYINENNINNSQNNNNNNNNITKEEIFQTYQSEGKTLFHIASSTNNEVIIDYILNSINNPLNIINLSDDNGFTPLINATISESTSIMKKLINAGADVNKRNNDGASALHFAAGDGSIERISLLVEAGADVTFASESGTALSWAAGNGRAEAIRYLAQRGCSCEIAGSLGIPPIFMAAVAPSEESVVALIENGADVGYFITGNLSVLHICAENGMLNAVRSILSTPTGQKIAKHENDDGNKPIHLAAMGSHELIIRELIPHSGDLPSNYFKSQSNGEIDLEAILTDGKQRLQLWMEKHQNGKTSTSSSSTSNNIPSLPQPSNSNEVQIPTVQVTPEQEAISESHKAVGNQHFSHKRYQPAIEEYTKAIDSNPLNHLLYSNRSACYLALATEKQSHESISKELKLKALHDAELCRKLQPTWVKGCYRLALARFELQMYEEAAVAAYEGCQLDSENDDLKLLLQKSIKKGREQYQKTHQK